MTTANRHAVQSNWQLSPKAFKGLLVPRSLLHDNIQTILQVANVINFHVPLKYGDLIGAAEPINNGCGICGAEGNCPATKLEVDENPDVTQKCH
jgi:hypothetical protein